MTTSKLVTYLTVISILLIIGIPTFSKVLKNHNDKLMLVTNKKILESAYQCIYDNKCKENKITLQTLYDEGYLQDDIINPITKTVYAKTSYVQITKDDAKFYEN